MHLALVMASGLGDTLKTALKSELATNHCLTTHGSTYISNFNYFSFSRLVPEASMISSHKTMFSDGQESATDVLYGLFSTFYTGSLQRLLLGAFPSRMLHSSPVKVSFILESMDEKQATTKELLIWQCAPMSLTPFSQEPANSNSHYVKNKDFKLN